MSDFELTEIDSVDSLADDLDDSTTAAQEAQAAPVDVTGKRIALAGKLGGMNRREAANLLRSYAAIPVDLDAAAIDWVVIGAEESPLSEGELLTPELRSAAAAGRIEVIAETELWQRLGLVDIERSVKRFYTPAMLAELLGVSVRVIRRWHRRGLIVPARTMHKLPYFDFQEVATARRLAELVAAGASPRAIEDRLRELAEVLPEVTRPLAQLSVLVEGRHVLLRQGEGLIEPGGQLRFDFAEADQSEAPEDDDREILPLSAASDPTHSTYPMAEGISQAVHEPGVDDPLLAAVYELEDCGDLAAAIDHCRAILARDGPRADINFQLGELLYRDGQVEAARERYFSAVEIDDAFVEARTSLACVLSETGRSDLAIAALEGVLSLHEDYPDAHYHLATIYEEQGDTERAAHHWQALKRLAPDNPWAP